MATAVSKQDIQVTPSTFLRQWIAAPLMSVILICSVACGQDQRVEDPVPPGAWATEVCTTISDWYDDINTLAGDFLEEEVDMSSGEALKESTLGFLDDLLAITDDMIQREEGAGIPDIEDGEGAVDRLMSAHREVRAELEDARSRIAALPTDDLEALRNGMTEVGEDLQEAGDRISAAAADLKTSEVAVISSSPTCQQLPAV
jgi:hypothetical protein